MKWWQCPRCGARLLFRLARVISCSDPLCGWGAVLPPTPTPTSGEEGR